MKAYFYIFLVLCFTQCTRIPAEIVLDYLYMSNLNGAVKSVEGISDSLKTITFYNKKGWILSRVRYKKGVEEEKYEYYYRKSHLMKIVRMEGEEKVNYVVRSYNKDGSLKEQVMTYGDKGQFSNSTLYYTNEKGEHIQSDVLASSGEKYTLYYTRADHELRTMHETEGLQRVIKFDTAGYTRELIYYDKGKETSHTWYTRNEYGDELKTETMYQAGGDVVKDVSTCQYVYDDHHNWIKAECVRNNVPAVTERKIVYYK